MSKKCLIIGASGDIGAKTAVRLANEGYSLLLHYFENKGAMDELLIKLPVEKVLQVIRGDLSNADGIHLFLQSIHFHVDAIVFASGNSNYGLFQDSSEVDMDQMLSIHVKSLWMVAKHFIPGMVTRKQGHIIVISSIWGKVGASCEVIYSSVKGAQDSFVKALAKELATSGISVNGIRPGFIETKMNQHLSTDERDEIVEEIPLKRAGQPEDVAHIVSFLLDDRSSYIQGEIIGVTGAW